MIKLLSLLNEIKIQIPPSFTNNKLIIVRNIIMEQNESIVDLHTWYGRLGIGYREDKTDILILYNKNNYEFIQRSFLQFLF